MLKIIEAYYADKNVTEIVSNYVENNKISLLVSNDIFGDPQPGIPKKLKVKYLKDNVLCEKDIKEDNIFFEDLNKPVVKFSVLTLTYRRYEILQEAIKSFLDQDFDGECEMVIINDSPLTTYTTNENKIKIINCNTRFSSIGKKLEFGFSQCKYEYIYRLDDDDLLLPWSLTLMKDYIENNPGYDIYRSAKHYGFVHNIFTGIGGNVNNGNIFTKNFINRIGVRDTNFGEDNMAFDGNYLEQDLKKYTMIYRWGMNTYHISGIDNKTKDDDFFSIIDNHSSDKENGNINIVGKFINDVNYYKPILEYHNNELNN